MTIRQYFDKYGVFSDLLSTNILTFEELYKSYYDQYRSLIYEIVQISGLDETPTVDETFLKYCLFIVGKATFFKDKDGRLLALNGTYSGVPDVYFVPELMIVSNPRLTESYEMKRGEECEVVYCREVDRYNLAPFGGLYPLISETATIIADNKISINVAQKNTRLINLISADTEQAKRSVEEVISRMYAGIPFGCVMSSMVDEIRSIPLMPNTTNRYIIDLIQLEQYALSHFYEKIGLYTHDQMKKERLITAEINDNANLPIFNIYNIIKTINEGFERVNNMFGTNYHAYINPLILDQIENLQERQEVAAETEEGAEPDEGIRAEDDAAIDEPRDESEILSESDEDPEDEDLIEDNAARSSVSDSSEDDAAEEEGSESSEDPESDNSASDEREGDEPEDGSGAAEESDGDQTSVEININGDISGDPEINIEVKAGDDNAIEGDAETLDGDRADAELESADSVQAAARSDQSESE